MKKTIRLTEADLTRIVKRIINEDLMGLLDGDSDNSESGMKMPKNYKTRLLDTYENFKKYTRGTKIGSSEHMYAAYVKSGENIEVIMNPENNKKIFVLNNSGKVYNELDQYMGNFKRDGYGKFMDYLENDDHLSDDEFMDKYKGKDLGWDAPTNKKLERMRSIRNKKRGGMNEDLMGLLDGDSDSPESIECAKSYVDFLFKPYNYKLEDGGDLHIWNKNRIPDIDDKSAYDRFIKHLKYCMNENLFDGECEGITFEDVAPYIQKLYINKIKKRS